MHGKILIADDESNITDVCCRYLVREGYQVLTASDGQQALDLWKTEKPDMLVLDLMMPAINGLKVCEEIRNSDDVPILILTARGDEQDRIMGLTMGADDYMVKPFSPRELVLRIKAILRRWQRSDSVEASVEKPAHLLKYGDLEIDEIKRSVKIGKSDIELTVKEFDLLLLLASHPEQVFSRNQLLSRVWENDYYGDTTTVTVHIRRLREKIEINPSEPRYIKTVWGIGYKFEGGSTS